MAITNYCHDLLVQADVDGVITPNNIIIGNKGDKGIARIQANLTDLVTNTIIDPYLKGYTIKLVIYDSLRVRNYNQDESTYNPIELIDESGIEKIEIKDEEEHVIDIQYRASWPLPSNIFEYADNYQCIIKIVETVPLGHGTKLSECWVSSEFIAVVNDTNWNISMEEAIQDAVYYNYSRGYLSKSSITFEYLQGHYEVYADNTELGNKKDRYIRTLQIRSAHEDNNLKYHFGVFEINGEFKAVLFKPFSNFTQFPQYCLIPKEATYEQGNIKFTLVDMNQDISEEEPLEDYQRWVSKTVTFRVIDNFIIEGDSLISAILLDTEVLEGNSIKHTPLVSSDRKYLIVPD